MLSPLARRIIRSFTAGAHARHGREHRCRGQDREPACANGSRTFVNPEPQQFSTSSWRRAVLLSVVPLLLLIGGIRSLPSEDSGKAVGQHQVYPVEKFRTVVLLLDSVGKPMALDPELMPFVSSLAGSSLYGESRACPGRATFPCVKSIFEGRTATTGTTLQDFSAVASKRTTWPASLAALGHRLVVTSDHTINRLYPTAFVDSMNYETLRGVPLLQRDSYAYRQARQWLDDPSIDVLILHIIGTDKVAHEYPVGGPEYREKYLEADNFVREVAGRLGPRDYLYVLSDHGHNQLGGHTLDAVYFAHGPMFPAGRQENLDASDMLFLLSAPYGLTLPEEYEGQVRTDLTLLEDDVRAKFLREQARLWRIPDDSLTSNEIERRLNEHVTRARERGDKAHAIDIAVRVAPWAIGGAFFLLSFLGSPGVTGVSRSRVLPAIPIAAGIACGLVGVPFAGWIVAGGACLLCVAQLGAIRTLGAAALLFVIGGIVFWLAPLGLKSYHGGGKQPLILAVSYALALIAGVVVTRAIGAPSRQQHLARLLWTVGIAVWLLAYFGPYSHALTGQGSKVVLAGLVTTVIVIAGGAKIFRTWPALLLLGLFPFVAFNTESYNIKYRLLDRVSTMPAAVGLSICLLLGVAWAIAMQLGGQANRMRLQAPAAALVAAVWTLICTAFFQFETGKVIGCILGSLWLAGVLHFFRKTGLPLGWSALAGVILLFAMFHFVLNGFALSHVDFRFASNKIIAFREEVWRAPQLIAWTAVKYLFILLPAFAVLFRGSNGPQLAFQLLQFGWWRELMIVVSSLGLAIFDRRGLDELCSEEIYFWTFLNIALCLFCLAVLWSRRRRPARVSAVPAMREGELTPLRS